MGQAEHAECSPYEETESEASMRRRVVDLQRERAELQEEVRRQNERRNRQLLKLHETASRDQQHWDPGGDGRKSLLAAEALSRSYADPAARRSDRQLHAAAMIAGGAHTGTLPTATPRDGALSSPRFASPRWEGSPASGVGPSDSPFETVSRRVRVLSSEASLPPGASPPVRPAGPGNWCGPSSAPEPELRRGDPDRGFACTMFTSTICPGDEEKVRTRQDYAEVRPASSPPSRQEPQVHVAWKPPESSGSRSCDVCTVGPDELCPEPDIDKRAEYDVSRNSRRPQRMTYSPI